MQVRELTAEEVAEVDGGIFPFLVIGVALGKGFVAGVGIGAAVEVGFLAYDLFSG